MGMAVLLHRFLDVQLNYTVGAAQSIVGRVYCAYRE